VGGLQDAGVPVLIFKGAAICTRYHRSPGARTMADVDLLVRPEDAERAGREVEARGWTRAKAAGLPLERVMRFKHSLPYRSASGAEIDLHWTPLHEPIDVGEVWEMAVPTDFSGVETGTLDAADELLVACAHGCRGGSAAVRWMPTPGS